MELDSLPGAATAITWFGYMPTFHDAEIVEIAVDDDGNARISVHAWHTSNNLEDCGNFLKEKHAIVTFTLNGVYESNFTQFNKQNPLTEIGVEEVESGYRLELHESSGASGSIAASTVEISIQPGSPA